MKNSFKILLLLFLSFFWMKVSFGQIKDINHDSINAFLIEKCKLLLQPHSDLSFSFASDELKNEVPDLKVKVPDLKDTTKYLEELKGDFTDWNVFYKIGKLYQRFNNNQSAFAHFEQAYNLILNAIKKDTLNPEYYSAMGSLYMNLNSQENALFFFNKAYNLNEKDSLARQFLPMFYIFSGKIEKAEELIAKDIEENPKDLNAYIWLISSKVFGAISHFDKSDKTLINKSIDELFDFSELNAAVKRNKNDVRFLILEQLGRQLALFAKYGVLADDFEKVELKPNDSKVLLSIRKSLEKFLSGKDFKNKYVLYKALGFNYLLGRDLTKAVELFKKSMTCWPQDKSSKDYYILFTTHYFLQKDTLSALTVIEEKIKNDNSFLMQNAADYVLLGNIYLSMNNYKQAEASYNKSLETGKNPDAYLGLAFLELKDENLNEANSWINKAYELNKENYLCYAMFGIITLMNNQTDAAKDALAKAMQLKPDNEIIREIYNTYFGD